MLSQLKTYFVEAIDGETGRVDDLYFHRGEWHIRYLLLRVAFEPEYRRVLLSTYSVQEVLTDRHVITLNLTRQQIRNSPETNVSQPISRPHEIELNQYYGWPADWLAAEQDVTPTGELSGRAERQQAGDIEEYTGAALQGCDEVTGVFRIQANDGEIGKITDFIVDDESWLLRYVIAEYADSRTGYVILATDMVERIDWVDGHFYVDAFVKTIREIPDYDPAVPFQKQQERLRAYYTR